MRNLLIPGSRLVLLLLFFLFRSAGLHAQSGYKATLRGTKVILTAPDNSRRTYEGRFTILYTDKNPVKELRRGDFGFIKTRPEEEGLLYNVATWGKSEKFVLDTTQHIEDGYNPVFDRSFGKDRTADYFLAAPLTELTAISATNQNGRIEWVFPANDKFSFKASLTVTGKGFPRIEMILTPKADGWFSAGFTGAPASDTASCEEIWQPLIWQEKRFPNLAYLSEASRCPVPTGFVQSGGITIGIVADPALMPFETIPTSDNSAFGILIRNKKGKAQPMAFAPVLGNANSRMKAGQSFSFTAFIYQKRTPVVKAYEDVARNICGFRDLSSNTLTNLNGTITNMTNYCLSPYAMFVDSLRGCSYSTDVPGAVKNISGLHPLSVALLSDNETIYKQRARPMLEYGLSRERFLFSTNPKVKGQGTSSRLDGPGVPLSDLSATYTLSGNRMKFIEKDAEFLYKNRINRSLNLDAISYADAWQNAMYLYRSTGDKKYRDAAIKGADAYLNSRVFKRQTDFNADTLSMGMFFWTSYSNQFMELYLLYLTTGEKRFLDAAWDGARHFAQFCWLMPMVPEGKITVNKDGKVPRYRSGSKYKAITAPEEEIEAWRVAETGLTSESSATSSGHRGIFMAQHAPFMLRIAAEKNDPFLRDIARAAVVGRYSGFPGYHINAGRTSVFEKPDFANRPLEELNAHTSLHYNHPWSHVAMLYDYLVADFFFLSNKKIDFPAEYAEGYAYCRSLIYGLKPGTFYGESNVRLFLPENVLAVSNNQANYLTAYGNGKFYIALGNQDHKAQRVKITINTEKIAIDKKKQYRVRVWKDNKPAGYVTMKNGELEAELSARGITAFAIEGVQVQTAFQGRSLTSVTGWAKDAVSTGFEGDRAVIFNFGKGLQSAYVWMEADNTKYPSATLHYAIDGKWAKLDKKGYPYDFTIEIPDQANKFEYYFEAVDVEGKVVKSPTGVLSR